MTDSSGHPAPADDPLASQRLELLGALIGAQFELQAAIAELARAGQSTADADNQMQALSQMQQAAGSAGTLVALASMRGDIAAAVGQAKAVAEQARVTAERAANNAADAVAIAAGNAHAQVNAIMAGMRDFDPHLRFASPEDEAEYRKREAERRRYIEEQQAKGTPQGDLNAANAAIAQLQDAGAYGADAHPDFADRLAALTASRDRLRGAMDRQSADASKPATTEAAAKNISRTDAPDRDDDLAGAMAALREAGVQTAADTAQIVADRHRAQQGDAKAVVATSGRG